MPDVAQLDAKIGEAEEAMGKAETTAEMRKAKERKEDLMRLKRVELIYVGFPFVLSFLADHADPFCTFFLLQSSVLPVLSSWVLVLLKLLSATVTAAGNGAQPVPPAGFPAAVGSRKESV